MACRLHPSSCISTLPAMMACCYSLLLDLDTACLSCLLQADRLGQVLLASRDNLLFFELFLKQCLRTHWRRVVPHGS